VFLASLGVFVLASGLGGLAGNGALIVPLVVAILGVAITVLGTRPSGATPQTR
jgi:hypothetical protein